MKRVLHAFVLLWLATPVLAQLPPATAGADPYEGRVAVSDQSASTRDAALREALTQVLHRLAGDNPSSHDLGAIAERAPQWVQRYGYEPDPETRQLHLVAAFDPRAIEAQLRKLDGSAALPEEEVRVTVFGIDNTLGYARTITRFKSLPGMGAVNVATARDQQLDLRLHLRGGALQLDHLLSSHDDWLTAPPPPGAERAYRLR